MAEVYPIVIRLKKIWHRDAYRIAAFFPYDANLVAKFKAIGATYSKTHTCWYVDYSKTHYKLITGHFEDYNIDTTSSSITKSKLASVDNQRQDLPITPAGRVRPENDTLSAVSLVHKSQDTEVDPRLKLKVLEDVGSPRWIYLI